VDTPGLIMFYILYLHTMKLTNKQLEIVKDMIREKVKAPMEAKQKAKDKALKDKAIALCEKHPAFQAYLKVAKELPKKYFHDIAIKDSVLHSIAKKEDDFYGSGSHSHIMSKEDFYDCIMRKLPEYNRYGFNTETETKRDIEKKIVMASINAKDLESLIQSVVKELTK
jgi:hypothetical protein